MMLLILSDSEFSELVISQADTSQADIGQVNYPGGHQPYLKNYYLPPVTG